MSRIEIISVIVVYYVGWFGSVLLASTEYAAASLLLPLFLIVLLFLRNLLNPRNFKLALLVSFVGILFDSILIHFGFISAHGPQLFAIPIWLISIWLLFSFSMIKLAPYISLPVWLASLLGFILGPLSYKSGEIFNVLMFTAPLTVFIYAIFWAIMFPSVVFVSKRFA